MTTEGYSAAEVGETYERALELSRRFGDRDIFVILSGVWVFHEVRGDLERARQVSVELLTIAEREMVPEQLLAANFMLGTSLSHLGELAASLDHLKMALPYYTGATPILALFAGPDVGFFLLSYLSHVEWHREDGKQGEDHAAEAIAGTRRLHHPFGEAIALNYAAMWHVFRGESRAALERGREAIALCRRHEFTYYLAMANIVTGWAAAAEDHASDGLAQLREGLEGLRKLGAELRLPYYFALLAETFGRAGQMGEALASLSSGFAFASKNGERWALAELYRVQGDLLASQRKPGPAQASYRQGLGAAQLSGSLALERKLSLLAGRTATAASAERS